MLDSAESLFNRELQAIRDSGLWKTEQPLIGPQRSRVELSSGQICINMCANNYLGLSDDPRVVEAARASYESWGFGLSSVRFICGTQTIHKELERQVSSFLGTEETILYNSCFDANGGLFETLLGPEDAVISDELNHASIIDGIRLCKAARLRYTNNDMKSLEEKLQEARSARLRLIATDGVFSMDGYIARLDEICNLAQRYEALVMMDDCHGIGVIGKTGRGTSEYRNVLGKVDIITGTFGKALGGAVGGFTSGRKPIIELLRQRSRPYLFSNTLAPAVVCASLKALELLSASTELVDRLRTNTVYFREKIAATGLDVVRGDHPIVPIMTGDAQRAKSMADALFEKGVYVVPFTYPVVPQGKARIRTQVSAGHSREDLDQVIAAFAAVAGEM